MAGDNGNDNPVTRSSNGFFASHVGINCYNDFIRLTPEVEHLTFKADCCNEDDFVALDLTRFHDLKELHVKEGSLKNVMDLKLHGLTKLETIDVGSNCFSERDCSVLEIMNCSSLTTITVGNNSFKWVKGLKMANLTKLNAVSFGEGSFSSSRNGTFEMRYCRGNNASIEFKKGSFKQWNEFIISDCSLFKICIRRDCFTRNHYTVFNSGIVNRLCDYHRHLLLGETHHW